MIFEFEGEERLAGVHKEAEEDFVALPESEVEKALLVNPFEIALVADNLLSAPLGGGEEVHILTGPYVADECHNTPVAPFEDVEACFLFDFAEHTLVGALISLAFSTNANPFVVAGIVLFLNTVKHKILVSALEIAKSGLFHLVESYELIHKRKNCRFIIWPSLFRNLIKCQSGSQSRARLPD